MPKTHTRLTIPLSLLGCLFALPAAADTTFFSTGSPDGKIATATRPESSGKFEIESADDFVLFASRSITDASFTGLISGAPFDLSHVGEVRVEIYRVFPALSDVTRTSGPPTFSTSRVPTRVNSPSDIELDDRDTASDNLKFTTTDMGSFTASNSVQPGGIHPAPGFHTGGNGSVTGEEVQFDVTFTTPFDLSAGHYFFVPQVEITDPDGNFFWLSAPKPIVPPPPGFTDLQSWTRDQFLDPDWLRVGADIVGGTAFNAAFSLSAVPEPSTWAMMLLGFAGLGYASYRRARRVSRAHA
jgi:PEP-CTERM motif